MLDFRNLPRPIEEQRPWIAVLPIGAIEQHGGHLAVGTDWLNIQEMASRVAHALDAYLLPAVPFSMSECHGPSSGTVWLRPETLADTVNAVVGSLFEQGVRNVVLMNGHGGNFILQDVVEDLRARYEGLAVVLPPEFPELVEQFFSEDAGAAEVHAGEVETSVQMYLNPDHVVHEEIRDFVPPVGREWMDYAFLLEFSPSGVWGRPSRATADKGRDYLTAWVRTCVQHVKDELAASGSAGPGR